MMDTLEKVSTVVCRHYDQEPDRLFTRSGKRAIAEPRQLVIAILNLGMRWSLNDSTRPFGLHWTYGCHYVRTTVINLYDTDPQYRARVDAILNDLELTKSQRRRMFYRLRNTNGNDHDNRRAHCKGQR